MTNKSSVGGRIYGRIFYKIIIFLVKIFYERGAIKQKLHSCLPLICIHFPICFCRKYCQTFKCEADGPQRNLDLHKQETSSFLRRLRLSHEGQKVFLFH